MKVSVWVRWRSEPGTNDVSIPSWFLAIRIPKCQASLPRRRRKEHSHCLTRHHVIDSFCAFLVLGWIGPALVIFETESEAVLRVSNPPIYFLILTLSDPRTKENERTNAPNISGYSPPAGPTRSHCIPRSADPRPETTFRPRSSCGQFPL